MKILLFLLIGFALGAAVLYFLQMKDMDRLDELEAELKKSRRDLVNAEEEHETRLKEAIATLQDDYQGKQDQRALNIKAEYEAKITALQSQLSTGTSDETPPESLESIETTTVEASISQTDIQPQIVGDETPPETMESVEELTTQANIPTQAVVPDAPSPTQVTFEPPILAAVIQYSQTRSEVTTSTPSGKQIEPPILAQNT